MEKQFLTYELAVELKKLGFGESCFGYYTVDEVLNFDSLKMFKGSDLTTLTSQSDWTTLAPLWQQAFDWLFNNFSYICIIENNMSYEQKQEKLKDAIRHIQDNKPK